MKTIATETKDFKFTLDRLDENEGTFTGYASVWNVVDAYGDTVKRGAFKKTLKDKKAFPLLWMHNVMEPIGVIRGKEDEHGLAVEGALNLDVQRAREARSLMKQAKEAGVPMGLSIGYQTVVEEIDDTNKTRLLKEINLWEISIVTFPACDPARIDAVKQVEEPVEGKPYPNEHACRLRDPGDFEEGSFKRSTRKHEGKEYSVIMGKLKDDDAMTEQAYRYAKDVWDVADAKAHCKAHDGISFEPASEKCENCSAALPEEPRELTPNGEPGLSHSQLTRAITLTMQYQKILRGE